MRRFRPLGWILVLVCIASSAVGESGSAAATLPSFLPEGTLGFPLDFNTSSGKTGLGTGIEMITSSESKGTGTGYATKLGTFRWLLEKTTDILDEACTGLASGEQAGNITVTGTYHIRDAKETVGSALTLVVAIAFLFLPIHFTCGSSILIIEDGCVAGLLRYAAPTGKEMTVVLERISGQNINKITKVLNEGNTAEENCELKVSENGGEGKLSSLEGSQKWSGFAKHGESVSPEVMPL